MKLTTPALLGLLALIFAPLIPVARAQNARPYQDLWVPPALEGKNFELALARSSKSFWAGATTATYSFNQCHFWGPTLIFNQGDTVQINVRNDLDEPTTVHWHGLHLPAAMDGGPHQRIQPGGTWSPSFTVKNNAGTFWYHPHPHEATQKQLTYGAGGLIIVRDPVEAALALPRTYGVDDLPLVLTSRRFYTDDQFSFEGDHDKYGDYLLTNGTLDAQVSLPAQFVRLRILNAEIERGYNLGFGDNRTFYLIATDGGLVDKPIALTRLKLMVGERVELLVNMTSDKPGSSLDLMAFNSGQTFGFPGQEPQDGRPNGSYLNNIDFRVLHIQAAQPTAHAVTELPQALTSNHFWTDADVTNRRTLRITPGGPTSEFAFDNEPYDTQATDHIQVVKLGAVEAWTIVNNRVFGHSFHLHDAQFKIASRSGGPVAAYERGWKDTVYVPRAQSVTVIARFDDFASDTDSYMYHCHMANHEDAGLMGEFMVVKDPATILLDSVAFRNRREHPVTPEMLAASERLAQTPAPPFQAIDTTGATLSLATADKKPLVLFFIERECSCSRDAAPFLDRLQTEYGQACTVVGVIDANPEAARAWTREAGIHFPVIPDPEMVIVSAYHASQSVYTAVVAPGGMIARTYPGYSTEMLGDLSATVAGLAGVPVRSFSINGAPKRPLAGCSFPAH